MSGASHHRPSEAVVPPRRSLQLVGWGALLTRRLLLSAAAQFTNRRFVFAFVTAAVFGAKRVHVLAHRKALPERHLRRWGASFFAQDVVLVLLLRFVLDGGPLSAQGPAASKTKRRSLWAAVSAAIAYAVAAFSLLLALISVSFFIVAGSEVHWRNLAFASDASSRALLLSGALAFALVVGVLLAVSWIWQNVIFVTAGLAVDAIECLPGHLARACTLMLTPRSRPHSHGYVEVLRDDTDASTSCGRTESRRQDFLALFRLQGCRWAAPAWQLSRAMLGLAMVGLLIMALVRPTESSLVYLSWTVALLPFVDFKDSSPSLQNLVPVYGSGIGRSWDKRTALDHPPPFLWLPEDTVPPGFEDWYGPGKRHYNAAADALKSSNLDEELLPALQGRLHDVPIRHVLIVMLESTRKDVFPFKKDGLIWQRFAKTFDDSNPPETVLERLSTLTPTANYLTGDYDDGFAHDGTNRSRGGISFENAHTTGTYTLKSLAGTLCGITPLVADFNLEYAHHIYQPCLPQIFDVLGKLPQAGSGVHDFTAHSWQSSFLQSVLLEYDNFDRLVSALGFPEDRTISKSYLKKASAKYGYVDLPDINYFGMAEVCLEEYIRDAFVSARENDERVFMTHITSTSHHPYRMPDDETYVPLAKRGHNDLSHYVNSIGYDDRWLSSILDILDQEEVANETLAIFVGDHGLSIPENDKLASYYNPNVGCDHVPLVISHPKLPALKVEAPVSAIQIVPTVLDLLINTGSLHPAASQAARDLLANYEGQSLIRPLRGSVPEKGGESAGAVPDEQHHAVADWQFTVMNPGRAMVGVRDARHAHWRLVVPVVDNIAWRFTDLSSDRTEAHPVLGFDFAGFLGEVEAMHGLEQARWAEEAAFVARWWVEENSRRWRYGPYSSDFA